MDADLEAKQGMPSQAKRLRQLMVGSDAIIIASPEYNARSLPFLKNVLDWTSRSVANYSPDAYEGKSLRS